VDLYLIRHAEAVQRDDSGETQSDAERPLTEAGEAQARALASGLRRRGVRLDHLVSSPLVRARQTAEGMLRHWPELPAELHECNALAPGGRRKRLARFLRELGGEAVGLVGHMPDLGRFAGWLLGSKRINLDLAKAGVALVRCDEAPGKGAGTLVWMITPEWLA
jgi:phosphohistidine phosphatase